MNAQQPSWQRRRLARWPGSIGGVARVVVVAAAAALAGCGTPPPTHWHTLMPAELAVAGSRVPAAPTPIALAAVRLPVQVDRQQWVVRLADESIAVLEDERWASPLRDELRQALLQSLAVRDGAVEAVSDAGRPAIRIGVDIRRFETIAARESRIEGAFTLQSGTAAPSRCEFLFRDAAGGSFDALAAAHRRNVGRLAAAIGDGLRAPASCPAPDAR